jgi:hypothetical protein
MCCTGRLGRSPGAEDRRRGELGGGVPAAAAGLGLRPVGILGRPTRAFGGSSGYQGRAGSHWFSTATSRTARSSAALMAGGGGLLGCSGARGRKGREFCKRAEAVPSPVVAYRKPQHGRGAAVTCGGAVGQWAEAVRRRRVCIGRVAPA